MVRPAKILVVDDDPDFLDSARTMLESSSCRVAVAPGEDEALAEMEADRPDLLILDVIMARWDSGFQLLWRLKADERYEDIPVLMVTAVDAETGMDFARHVKTGYRAPDDEAHLPVDDYLVKPVRTAELVGAVDRILRRPARQTQPR